SCTPTPPSDSDVSVLGSTFATSELNAELFSIASLFRYPTAPSSPPAASNAARMASLSCTVVLFSDPGGRPAPARALLPRSNWPLALRFTNLSHFFNGSTFSAIFTSAIFHSFSHYWAFLVACLHKYRSVPFQRFTDTSDAQPSARHSIDLRRRGLPGSR